MSTHRDEWADRDVHISRMVATPGDAWLSVHAIAEYSFCPRAGLLAYENKRGDVDDEPPAFAVVDMRLGRGNGLDVIAELVRLRPTARAIVLTAYDSLATAVFATKLGAYGYITKPADADDVVNALLAGPRSTAAPPQDVFSATRVRWEHIQRVYELCDRNVSETARRLAMHRRTLQRVLGKRAPK